MKELAAETLMVGNVDLEFEGKKKSQLICVTKQTHSFPWISFAFGFITCLYCLAKFSQPPWFCIIYWKACFQGWRSYMLVILELLEAAPSACT